MIRWYVDVIGHLLDQPGDDECQKPMQNAMSELDLFSPTLSSEVT